jgi:hypothetical protein
MSPVGIPECPHCHESFPDLPQVKLRRSSDGGELRRGLLYMTLAGVIHYFAGGYSSWQLPVDIPPPVIHYLTPALFVLGLGFAVFGLTTRFSSR